MFKRLINRNFRKPVGLMGRYIIRFLKKNQPEYDELEPLLKLNNGDVVKKMEKTGFTAVETVEHSLEKNCYYILGYKPKPM